MIPAKLVGVCVNDKEKHDFKAKQLPFIFDETAVMVVQFEEKNPLLETFSSSSFTGFVEFEARLNSLTKKEIEEHICLKHSDVISMLSETAQCVGCRRSAEDMLTQAAETNVHAFDPLQVTADCCVIIDQRYHKKPGLSKSLFILLNNYANRIAPQIEGMIRCRRSRRCVVHSLDSQRPRTSTGWLDVWELMSDECRKEMAVVDAEGLLTTLNDYVQRHKFCSECKARVLTAYDILVGSEEGNHVKGFSASLYQKISACSSSNHLHLPCDSDFLSSLIARAEPELFGSQRERHANTVDAAQEEVLTCVGLHVFDRFHRLASRLRADHQTWNLLVYTCILALKRKLDVIVEQRRGLAHIDAVCAELQEMDKSKEKKKKKRKDKKKILTPIGGQSSIICGDGAQVQNLGNNSCSTLSELTSSTKINSQDLNRCDCSAISEDIKMRDSSSDLDNDSDVATDSSSPTQCLTCTPHASPNSSGIVGDFSRVNFGDESARESSPFFGCTPPVRSSPTHQDQSKLPKLPCKCEELQNDHNRYSSNKNGTRSPLSMLMTCERDKSADVDNGALVFHSSCCCDDEGDEEDDGEDELTAEELRQYDSELLRVQREALRARIREQFNLRLKQLAAGGGPQVANR